MGLHLSTNPRSPYDYLQVPIPTPHLCILISGASGDSAAMSPWHFVRKRPELG